MTEEERGAAGGSSVEELGQKVDALEGAISEYRAAKRSNRATKIIIVLVIVAVALVYVLLFGMDIFRLYSRTKGITEDREYQKEIIQALQDQLSLMRPQLNDALKDIYARVKPKLLEELEGIAEEMRPEIEEAVGAQLKLLYDRIDEEITPHLESAVGEVIDKITEQELAAFSESIQPTLLKELKRTGGRILPRLQEALREETRVLSETLSDQLEYRMKLEFEGLLDYYLELLETKFPEIADEEQVTQMAANVQVAFEEAVQDIISERLKEHSQVLLDITDVLERFEREEKVTEQQLLEELRESLVELLEIKLATEVVKAEVLEEE